MTLSRCGVPCTARRTQGRWRSAPASGLSSRPTTSSGSAPRRPCTSGTRSSRDSSPIAGTLASFATLGVGFLSRPLGGILGGHLGDKVGRKPVLVASLIVMGLATFVIGLLPTYASVGILAPILLVIVRIIQGVAFGAEWGGAILMSYEHAPWRQKGRYTGMVQAGFPVGLLLANLVFLGSVHLGGDWAWRVPFLASIFLVIVGLIIRAKVPESPVFEDVKEHGDIVKSPIVKVIKEDWRNIVRGIGLRIAETAGYAVSITYMISYLKNAELATKSETLTALCIASAIGIFATMGWARLTDKIGRRTVYVWACAFAVPFGVLMFLLVNTGIFLLIIATFVLAYGVVQNSLAGAQGAWFPELFHGEHPRVGSLTGLPDLGDGVRASPRSSPPCCSSRSAGSARHCCSAPTPRSDWLPALATRETWGPRERQLADEAAAAAPALSKTNKPPS